MNKKEIEKIGDPEEHDWNAFFAKISIACPWSQKYWNQNKIEIVEWTGEILELSNDCIARVYKHPTATPAELHEISTTMNRKRENEEWFDLLPDIGPVGLVIQQDKALLNSIREEIGGAAAWAEKKIKEKEESKWKR